MVPLRTAADTARLRAPRTRGAPVAVAGAGSRPGPAVGYAAAGPPPSRLVTAVRLGIRAGRRSAGQQLHHPSAAPFVVPTDGGWPGQGDQVVLVEVGEGLVEGLGEGLVEGLGDDVLREGLQ